jgi:dipeptidyl aminopeptidase/acylaminoacyl peptidase
MRMSRRIAGLCSIIALAACTPAIARATTAQNGLFFTMSTTATGSPPRERVWQRMVFLDARGHLVRKFRFDLGAAVFVALAPDGRHFAYSNSRGLWVASMSLRRRHRVLANSVGRAWYPYASWSPDGRRLAVLAGSRLLSVRADGHDVVVLARVAHAAGPVVWSRDGQSVAFLHNRFSERRRRGCRGVTEVVAVPAWGGQPRPLYRTPTSCLQIGEFDWSPDRRRLVLGTYAHQPHRGEDRRAAALEGMDVVDTQDGSIRRIAPGGGFDATWSPDGRTVAFLTHYCPESPTRQAGTCLRTVRRDGRVLRLIARMPEDRGLPTPLAWLPRD